MTKVMYLLPVVTNGVQLEPANYDWQAQLPKPLNVAQLKAESDYREAMQEIAFRSWYPGFNTSSKEIAITTKQFRLALSDQVKAANEAANRPDSVPSDMSVIKNDTILGMADATAWRNAQHSVAKHIPGPLPGYSIPQRSKTASELQVEAWLAQDRSIRPIKASGKGVRRLAKFWDHGDGHKWTQPIDSRNAELRLMAGAA